MGYHYESPIRLYWSDVETTLTESVDGAIVARAEQMLDIQIDEDELMKALKYDRDQYNKGYHDGLMQTLGQIEVVRCKDCIHRPEITDPDEPYGLNLTFPNYECPCQCADPWYSWRPDDDWYCPKGEKDEKDI